jgi:membrane protein
VAVSSRLDELKRDLDALGPQQTGTEQSGTGQAPQQEKPQRPQQDAKEWQEEHSRAKEMDTQRRQGVTPEADRGRGATTPTQIPAPGWKDVLLRSWKEVSDNNIFLAAGGVTYAVLVALFPALAALVSIYGLVLDPAQVEQQVKSMSSILPPETTQMISDELHNLVSHSNSALGIGVIVSLLLALWSASRGMSGLISALNMAYEQKETRSFIKFNAIAVGLTVLTLIGGTIIIALVGVLPAAVQFIGLGAFAQLLVLILEWPLLILVVMTGLAVLYRYAPNRDKPQWRWVSPGAVAATVLWLVGSVGFSAYVNHFNSYSTTYGSLGGVVILLTWLWLSSFVALFGAVINAQSERQTVADSTEGHPKPLGERRAYAADTVGEKTS